MKKKTAFIEYENGTRVALDADDAPELTEEWFKNAKHGIEGLSEIIGNRAAQGLVKASRRGRPRVAAPKINATVRFDADVLAAFKATGKGWQSLMGAALAEYAKTHGLIAKPPHP